MLYKFNFLRKNAVQIIIYSKMSDKQYVTKHGYMINQQEFG